MNNDFNLSERMAINVKWAGSSQVFSYICQLIVWVIFARLLPAQDFGALSIALAFSNLVLIFNELGIGDALIQKKELKPECIITAFWIYVIIGLIFSALALSLAYPIASFFKNTNIRDLIVIFTVKFLIDSFAAIQEALLKRNLSFKKLAIIEFSSSLVFILVSITMMLNGFGIISIAWGYLVRSVIRFFLLWQSFCLRLSFKFDRKSFQDLFNFGRNIIGFRIVSYLSNNVDIFLIARFLGTLLLGYYSMALNLVNFPRQKLSSIISSVAFPIFSRMQDDISRLRRAYFKIIRYSAIINFPLLIGMIWIAPEFVNTVYTGKWQQITIPLEILCIYGLCFSITTFVGIVFNATGHPDYSFKFSLFSLLGMIVAISFGIRYNLVGIAIALSIYAIIMGIAAQVLISRIIKTTIVFYLQSMAPAIISSTFMSFGLYFLKVLRGNFIAISPLQFLVIATLTGTSVYTLTLFLFYRECILEMRQIVHKMFT